MRIRAVTFDFWGTLYESVSPESARRRRRRAELVRSALEPYAARGAPPSLDRVEGALYRASRLRADEPSCERSGGFARRADPSSAGRTGVSGHPADPAMRGFTVAERLGWLARRLDLSVPEEVLRKMAEKVSSLGRDVPPRPFGPAGAVVCDLSADFALGLVSDTGLTGGVVLREIMRKDGLAPPVRAFSFSDETGVAKPHAGAFLRALDELRVRPEEAVHVGDVLATDVAGACGLGMKAVWIGGGPPWGSTAVAVRGLEEVPAAIRSML